MVKRGELVSRDFVLYESRLGIVFRNDREGGVFRGHVLLWFGELSDEGRPVLEQVLSDECELFLWDVGDIKGI